MPTLSPKGSVVVFRDEHDVATLFAYSPHGGSFLTLMYRSMRPVWSWMRFFEIVDVVPIRHVVLCTIPLPVHNVVDVEHLWCTRLHSLLTIA